MSINIIDSGSSQCLGDKVCIFIGHKSCNILSILNKLKLQKELQTFVTNTVFFFSKKEKTQQKPNKK